MKGGTKNETHRTGGAAPVWGVRRPGPAFAGGGAGGPAFELPDRIPIRQIVSDIIIQAEELIQVRGPGMAEDGCGDV